MAIRLALGATPNAVLLLVIGIALVATVVPAIRASRLNPARALWPD